MLNHHESATAHLAWDERWSSEAGRAAWVNPDREVLETIDLIKGRKARKVLDLGCGVGRHALAMARAGFEVWAVDASCSGLKYLKKKAMEPGLQLQCLQMEMTEMPFDDEVFDYVLAWNVIYHGVHEVVENSVAEITRVLKPGGLFHGTMLSTRHHQFGEGREIAPGVFVRDEEAGREKNHPHMYCSAEQVTDYFKGYELLSLTDRCQSKPETYHWTVLAEKIHQKTH